MSGFARDSSSLPGVRQSRRRYRRWVVDLPAYIDAAGNTFYCLIYDITPAGARLRVVSGGELAPNADVFLDLEGYGQIPALVRHSSQDNVGLQFLHDERGEAQLHDWLFAVRPARRQHRYSCRLPAMLAIREDRVACIVTDLSRSGAAVEVAAPGRLSTGDEVRLMLPEQDAIAASVRHIEGNSVGLLLIDGYQGELPPPR